MKMRGESTVRTYYTCFTQNRGLPCSAPVRSTPGHIVEEVFGDLLRRYQLGDSWRTDLLHLLEQQTTSDYWEEIERTRQSLEAEKKKLNVMFRAGGIETEEYEREMQGVNARLAQLPRPEERERYKAKALEAGEVLASLSECWDAAQRDQNFALLGEYVNSMLRAGGLVWDAEKRAIQALRPHPEYVPVLLLVMGKEWKQDREYLVCEQPLGYRAAEKKWPMTPEQRQRIEQLHTQGVSVRGIAEALGIGRMTVQRYLKWCESSQE
jgi:AcrR family transcriptional regulator